MKYRYITLLALCIAFAMSDTSYAWDSCIQNGKKMSGKVQVVTSFPDVKVQIVESFPDLKVKQVSSYASNCGEWEFVTSFPDFTVQFVTSFPDLKIKFVESFPGVD